MQEFSLKNSQDWFGYHRCRKTIKICLRNKVCK